MLNMQQHAENDLIYLLTSLEAAEKITIYRSPFFNALEFFESEDQLHFNASLLLIATIGDRISKVSNTTKEKYPAIPWLQIKGMHNRIVHDYDGVDFELTFIIVTHEIPRLISDFTGSDSNRIKSRKFFFRRIECCAK
jgi:uncharacterized protein with HEPN domain